MTEHPFAHDTRDFRSVDAQRLARLSQRHGGLFTRQDAMRCGYTASQIRRRLKNGEWVSVLGKVLAVAALPITRELCDIAAHLAIPGSVLAGPSAARRWRMPVENDGIYLYVGRHGNSRIAGVTLWHAMPDKLDLGKHGCLPVTWRERTVIDCLRVIPERAAIEFLDRALLRRWITMDGLVERIRRHAGRRDVGKLIRLMRLVADGTRSAAERRTAQLFRQGGIVGWSANAPIRDTSGIIGLGDFVFEQAKLVVEIDGLAFHQGPRPFQHDRERQNRLQRAGWVVLRFTWYDVRYRPQYVIDTVRGFLAKTS